VGTFSLGITTQAGIEDEVKVMQGPRIIDLALELRMKDRFVPQNTEDEKLEGPETMEQGQGLKTTKQKLTLQAMNCDRGPERKTMIEQELELDLLEPGSHAHSTIKRTVR
jgi:hypothetical protein